MASPASKPSRVDFPHPLGPMIATLSPPSTSSRSRLRACTVAPASDTRRSDRGLERSCRRRWSSRAAPCDQRARSECVTQVCQSEVVGDVRAQRCRRSGPRRSRAPAVSAVELRDNLVGEQNRRPVCDRHRKCHPLCLTTRQVPGNMFGTVTDIEPLEELARDCRARRRRTTATAEYRVRARRSRGPSGMGSGCRIAARCRPVRARTSARWLSLIGDQGYAVDLDRPGIGFQQPGDQGEQRRLSATRWTCETRLLAGLDREVDLAENRDGRSPWHRE